MTKIVCQPKRVESTYVFTYVKLMNTAWYSRVQKSIENWSVWSKMALGEVGVSLP